MELRNDTFTSVRQKIQALGTQATPLPKLNPMQFKEMKESFDKKMTIRRAVSMPSTRKQACQSPAPNTCTVMENKWVKLHLTLIKSHPLLLLRFYSLSYLLPICLHWPLLRRRAPLIPSQNWDSLAHSFPLSIPYKNLRSKVSPPASHGWTCPSCIQRLSSSLPSSLPDTETAKCPVFTYSGCLLLLRRQALTINFLFQIGISAAWVFSS